MPIKWSAVRVSEAMDKVELQLTCAQPFIDQALATVQEARRIPNLAGYMDESLARVEWDIKEKFNRIKVGIESVRKSVPEGAIEEEQERLFEPYHRLESDREHLSGLGLGLALCKTLVELHGGHIWVKSQQGKGSTFSFSVPVEAPVSVGEVPR